MTECKYTGGTVLHLYMSEQLSSAQACKQLIKTALTRFKEPLNKVAQASEFINFTNQL